MISDIYCDKCQYLIGDTVNLIVESEELAGEKYCVSVKHLGKEVFTKEIEVTDKIMTVEIGKFEAGGYEVSVGDKYTAFDVVESNTDSLRYGFLSEFYEEDREDGEDIKQLNKYHINIVQFYD